MRAHDEAGATDAHTFRLAVERGRLVNESLLPAFAGAPYRAGLTAEHMAEPLAWGGRLGNPPGRGEPGREDRVRGRDGGRGRKLETGRAG